MSFKTRNTLALGIVFLLITGGGLFYYIYLQPKQLEHSVKEIRQMEQQLKEMPTLISDVELLTRQYQDTRRRYESRSKEIPTSDMSSQTYAYMSRGIDESGNTKFNMRFTGVSEMGQYGINTYELYEGLATFSELYKFIYFLENGRRLYKISSINIDQREGIDEETRGTKRWVTFTMQLQAFFTSIDVLGSSLAARALPIPEIAHNPFDPLIYQTIANEPPEGEIDASALDVKAVLPGKAFALHGSELLVLHLGDKVWRGSVTRISPAESLIEFMLDEGGVIRKLQKKIVFEKMKK